MYVKYQKKNIHFLRHFLLPLPSDAVIPSRPLSVLIVRWWLDHAKNSVRQIPPKTHFLCHFLLTLQKFGTESYLSLHSLLRHSGAISGFQTADNWSSKNGSLTKTSIYTVFR